MKKVLACTNSIAVTLHCLKSAKSVRWRFQLAKKNTTRGNDASNGHKHILKIQKGSFKFVSWAILGCYGYCASSETPRNNVTTTVRTSNIDESDTLEAIWRRNRTKLIHLQTLRPQTISVPRHFGPKPSRPQSLRPQSPRPLSSRPHRHFGP